MSVSVIVNVGDGRCDNVVSVKLVIDIESSSLSSTSSDCDLFISSTSSSTSSLAMSTSSLWIYSCRQRCRDGRYDSGT